MIIKIFVILICFILLFYYLKQDPYNFIQLLIIIFNINIEIKGEENLKYLNNRVLIMSNHHDPCDYNILYYYLKNITNKKIYTVTKFKIFGDPSDKNIISNIMGLFKKEFCNYFQFIPYDNTNKYNGLETQNKIVEKINENNTVIIFPEGKISRLGLSKEFKPGSFKMCANNNISIIPITIYYNKRVGYDINNKYNVFNLINSIVTLEIHKPIYDQNWEILRTKVYNTIIDPLKNKYKQLNIIN